MLAQPARSPVAASEVSPAAGLPSAAWRSSSVATAVIHFAVAGSHFQEYWLFGVFMLAVGWLQLLWAVGAVVRPSSSLLAGGALLNAAIIAVYVVTRTMGDIVGPTPHATEPFGFGDGLCTVLEAVIAAGCVWLLAARADQPVRHAGLIGATAATGGVTAVLLSAALVAGGPEMVMSVSASASASTSAARGPAAMHMPACGGPRGHRGHRRSAWPRSRPRA